jgi:hypothetical protein
VPKCENNHIWRTLFYPICPVDASAAQVAARTGHTVDVRVAKNAAASHFAGMFSPDLNANMRPV